MPKRQRRNPVQRAYNKGLLAGRRGHSSEDCPHSELGKKGSWLEGWRQGRAQFVAGYIEPPDFT
jgi:ribosome modulation factor